MWDPLEAGIITRDRIIGIGDVLTGKHPGRTADDQINYHFKNNGTAAADLAIAKIVYDRAVEDGRGLEIDIAPSAGEGPQLDALKDPSALRRLRGELDHEVLIPVYETIDRVKGDLPGEVALLGFCGAPWTVATYMIGAAVVRGATVMFSSS